MKRSSFFSLTDLSRPLEHGHSLHASYQSEYKPAVQSFRHNLGFHILIPKTQSRPTQNTCRLCGGSGHTTGLSAVAFKCFSASAGPGVRTLVNPLLLSGAFGRQKSFEVCWPTHPGGFSWTTAVGGAGLAAGPRNREDGPSEKGDEALYWQGRRKTTYRTMGTLGGVQRAGLLREREGRNVPLCQWALANRPQTICCLPRERNTNHLLSRFLIVGRLPFIGRIPMGEFAEWFKWETTLPHPTTPTLLTPSFGPQR